MEACFAIISRTVQVSAVIFNDLEKYRFFMTLISDLYIYDVIDFSIVDIYLFSAVEL